MSQKPSNYSLFRMLLAYRYGNNQKASLVYLGISRKLLLAISAEQAIPDSELARRIWRLSNEWPYGEIAIDDWPRPAVDRRGTRRAVS